MSQAPQEKKLVLISATSTLVIDTSSKAQKVKVFDKILCIYYPIQFQKDKGKDVLALLDFTSKPNAITLAYTA